MKIRAFCIAIILVVTVSMPSYAQNLSITSGLNWLSANQNAEGSWGANTATTVVDTAEVIKTKINFGNDASIQNAATWLTAQEVATVDELSRKVSSLSYVGTDTSSLISVLINARNSENGWGYNAGYSSTPLDTALALQALNYTDLTTINPALAYLTGSQNPDGGWGFSSGDDSNIYITAIVSATLQQFPQMTTIATAVSRASTYLLAQQNADGGFGASSTAYETALAYSALVAVSTNQAALANAINYLTATQALNGSWNDDPYSTALALKALYLSENKPSPPPPPPAGGKITGTVIDKITNQHIGNASVVLDSNNLINTATDSSGTFTLSDIPAGAQKVNFSYSGYAATSATATVVIDTTANLGTIPMTSSYSTGTIAGTITDSTGKPLTGVAITITGAWSGSATTGADGTYSFSYVTPGSVTISAAKTGFQTVTANGTVYARTTLTFSPRMSTTASQVTTGILAGRVVDSYWGVPIDHLPGENGVEVTLSGKAAVPVDANNGGYFTIPSLAPGTYQVIVGMQGFKFHTFRIVILPGVTTDLGTIRLDMSFLMTLTGKITDASTGAPIPGAEVTIQGKVFTGRTDASGTYAIADIPNPGEYTVKFTADGYVGKSFTMGSSPWLQTMDIALSQRVITGSLTGTVIDAATSLPLAGVAVTLANDSTVTATTDSSGVFTLNSIPPGLQRFTLSLNGYTARTLSTVIRVGVVGNAGKLPLGVTELPATIQGTAQKVGADAPFADVTIRTTGNTPLQTVTVADGTYVLDAVPPGTVTVTANALSNPGFTNARFTSILEPGGILVFNPALSMTLSGTFDLTVKTDKAVYGTSDTVDIAINLRNREAETIVAALHVLVTDPYGVSVYETSANVNIDADGATDQPQSFLLPATAKSGRYMVLTEAFDATGALFGNSYKYFDVTVSQIAITPVLPAAFSAGNNALLFNLVNSGTLAVSAGAFSVTLKDPDGQIVSTATQNFNLALGENKTIAATIAIPSLKFGTYTLTYLQSDETKPGQATDIALPNTLAIAALYDDASHRIRGTANLTVTLRNTGRFDIGTASVMAAVPDATYSETKNLVALAVGSGSALLYQFTIPETMTAGQHGTRITVTLPSGSTTAQAVQLAIMESSLSLSPLQTTFTAGETIHPIIANSGGVDTPVQYRLSLYDAKAALIVETTNTGIATAGASLSIALAIPTGAVDGSYNLVVTYKDTKTGKEATVPNGITITGVKGTLQVQTGKENYLLTESITGTSSTASTGTPLAGGNLHLQVTTGQGAQKTKAWTTQADFQTGVRGGVDTYGVNDWIVPDDDFSGTVIDANKWYTGGTVSIQSGSLFLDSTQATSGSGVSSKWSLEGDFDIQTDFMSNNSTQWTGAQFYVSCGNGWVNIGNYTAPGYASQIGLSDVPTSYIYAGSNSDSGKLRITRTGNKIVSYYWGGTSWVALNNATSSGLANTCSVGMTVWRGPGYPGATATFDNFKVNSGRIKTENQTVDSVRLLPLNDNFDDGAFNADRWINGGNPSPFPMAENNGVLNLNIPANGTVSGGETNAISRQKFTGDFDISIDYDYTGVMPGNRAAGIQVTNYVDMDFNVVVRWPSPHYSGYAIVSGKSTWGIDVWAAPLQGKLRITRVGTTYTSYYWKNNGWLKFFNFEGPADVPMLVWITGGNLPGNGVMDARYNNFTATSQTYPASGTIKLKYDSGRSDVWKALAYNGNIPDGTSISFRTRTSETEVGLAAAIWSDCLSASGLAITSPSGRWIEIEATLATSNTRVTPILHDLTVIQGHDPGQILWQTDVPANLAQGAANQLNHTIGTLGMTGKFYLEGVLTSSTGQSVASAVYPFYVEQGNIQIHLAPDKKIYRPGETVTITGEVKNLSSIAAIGLTARVQGTGVATPYSEAFDLPANSSRPFSITSTAGSNGVYQLTGSVTQNSTTLADIADQYEVASPAVTATITAPDTVANEPFNISVSIINSGKVNAATNVHVVDDSGAVIGDQAVSVVVGESRVVNFTGQITGTTTYTAAISGDLNQTLTKKVAYTVLAADSNVNGTIVTDKVSYNPNEQVTLTSTLSSISARENLSSLITVTNSLGQAVYSATSAIPSIIKGQTVTNKAYWNSGTYPAGTYLVTLQITNSAGSAIGKATCNLVINSASTPTALLKGTLSLDKQSILTGETVTVSYRVTNTGNSDLANIPFSIKTVNMTEQTEYNTIADQAPLAMGATYTKTGAVDTSNYSAKDYLVVLRATIGGVEETIAGSYFRVEGAPSAPALISPANSSDVDTFTPTLTVSNAADPNDDKLSYEFEVYSDSALTQRVTSGAIPEATGATAWIVPAPLTENRTYFWRTRAYDGKLYGQWMTPASFRVNTVNDPPTAPTVSSPSEGTSVATLTPTMTVTNASDPDSTNLTYNFAVALDPDFTQIVASITGVAGGQGTTSWTVPVNLQENGLYYWRAQADDWLTEGAWSTTSRFLVNTANDAPTAPVVTSPVNGTTVTAMATDVVVTNSSDPDSTSFLYYFEADTAQTFDSTGIIRSGGVTEGSGTTLWNLSGLRDNTHYYLRVKSNDGSADSPWSTVVTFAANTVNDPPTTPSLANPSNGAGVSVFTPTLSVHNSTDLDKDSLTYEFELYSDAALTNMIAQSGPVAETTSVTAWTTPAALTENQTYYWRASASDGLLYSGWMPTASFMVNTANDAPGAPQLSAPTDGSTLSTLSPLLEVVNALDPDSSGLSYDFELYSNNLLVTSLTAIPAGASGKTSVTLGTVLADNTSYTWRARAFDGDRYGQWMNTATFKTHIAVASIRAEIEFEPETLNRKSAGKWVKVEIELPHGYRAADIDISSIRLEGTVAAETSPHSINHKEDSDELTVKFRRDNVIAVLPEGNHVPVHVTGRVGGVMFEGVDIIRVIK